TGAIEVLPAGIKQHDCRVLGNDISERDRLFEHSLASVSGTTFSDLNNFDVTQSELTTRLCRPLAVALTKLGLRTVFQPSDGGNSDGPRPPKTTSWAVVPPGSSPTTSSRDCRKHEFQAGKHVQCRRRRRPAPRPPPSCLRHEPGDHPPLQYL